MVDENKKQEDSIFYEESNDFVMDTRNTLSQSKEKVDSVTYQKEIEKNKKDDVVNKAASIVYWISLFAAIIGNFISSVILIPFILMLQSKVTLYLVVMIMGLVFGALFNFLLNDIQKLDPTHHVVGGAVIPALAVINVYIMVEIATTLGTFMDISVDQSGIIISILYVAMFIVPYMLGMVGKRYKVVTA